MKKFFALLLVITSLFSALPTLADGMADADVLYIIPDSDSRLLTEKELWQYTYETLGFIRNEIQARHGYAFRNKKFFDYFNAKPWYSAGGFVSFEETLNNVEQKNIRLVYQVESAMKARNTQNKKGIDITDIINTQNALGGYGNLNDYGNYLGNGEGKHYTEKTEAEKKEELREKYTVTPKPNYIYNSQYIIPDSNTRSLTAAELWAYTRETLRYIRNELLARHGYIFGNNKYGRYFGTKDWYKEGGYENAILTTLEWNNINLIREIERHMDELETENETGLDIAVIIRNQNNGTYPGR